MACPTVPLASQLEAATVAGAAAAAVVGATAAGAVAATGTTVAVAGGPDGTGGGEPAITARQPTTLVLARVNGLTRFYDDPLAHPQDPV